MNPEHRLRHRPLLVGLCLSALSSGCLVADPPQYEEPATTPVFLDVAAATPLVGRVIVDDPPVQIDFDVPIRSEDNGDRVTFGLFQDFGFPDRTKEVFCGRTFIPPGTFDETDRAVRFSVVAQDALSGCYQLTLLVSHEKNWDFVGCRPDLIRGVGDTSMITWWLNVVRPGQNPSDLINCPTPSEVQP